MVNIISGWFKCVNHGEFSTYVMVDELEALEDTAIFAYAFETRNQGMVDYELFADEADAIEYKLWLDTQVD